MAASGRDVRKTVTVLFCDLVGSTALGSRLDPESLRNVQARYFDEMRAAVEAHGGTVEKFIGDAVMAVFGVPHVHEDDALRAARAATDMRRRLETLNDELERTHGVRLEARTALTSGEVVAGTGAAGAQRLVTGDVVNTAKRLEEAAGAGEIVVGDAARALLGSGVSLEPVPPISAKGKGEALVAWRLLDVGADAAALPRRFDTPLVGRAHELAFLRTALERAVERRTCELVTVVAPAGVGKTRLARELLATAAAANATTLGGRCLPYGDGITFWPLADVVRDAGGLEALRARLADVPDAAVALDHVAAAVGLGGAPAGAAETSWAVRRLLEALARDRPVVLCLEDIHWAEPTLLDLIEYVVGWSRDAPILLLCLARPELLEIRPEWGSPRPNAHVVSLEPLTSDEARTLLELLAMHDALAPAARDRIVAVAEGNPLFVEQLSAMLADDPHADASTIPPSLQVLLAARLERLAADERRVLERASVAGKEFWRSAVAALFPEEARPAITPTLMSLVRKGLVSPADTSSRLGDDAFRFVHVLIRDAAYDSVSKEERSELHERFAEWFRATAGERAGEFEEIEGYHLEQAFRYREQLGPVDERARHLATRAGELLGAAGRRAFARDDVPAAVKLLDRALALLTDRDPSRLELMRELSSAFWSIGEVARAEALLNGFLDAATALGDRRAEWYALLDRAIWRHIADPAASADDLLDVSERAIRVFDELGDDCGLARAWRRMAYVPRARGHFAISADAVERAIVHARRAGDAQEEARSIDNLCTVLLVGPTPALEAIRRCEQLLADTGTRLMEANIATSLAGLRAMRGEFDAARELCTRAEAIYGDLGLRLSLVATSEIVGYVELLAGDAAAAEAALRRGYEILAPGGVSPLVGFQAGLIAIALIAQGRLEEADEPARMQERSVPAEDVLAQVQWRITRSRLDAEFGNADAAHELAHEAVGRAAQTDALNLHGDALLNLAEVQRAAGKLDESRSALERAVAVYERKGNVVSAQRAASLPTELGARMTRK